MPALPRLQRARPSESDALKVEDALAKYADALTGDRGLLNGGLLLGEHVRAARLAVDVDAPDDWLPLPLTAGARGWAASTDTSFLSPAYRKADDGAVQLRGLVRYTGTDPLGVGFAIATLPADYAPGGNVMLTNGGFSPSQTRAETSGAITWHYGESTFLSLAQCEWTASNRTPADWPAESQPLLRLPDRWTGEVGAVLLLDARTADGRRYTGLPVRWAPDALGQFPGVRVLKVLGLPAGMTYTCTFLALPTEEVDS